MTAYALRVTVLMGLLLWMVASFSEPTHKASGNGIEITVYSEPCAFKEYVSNLPQRATWKEQGKTFEGCGGFHPIGVALFWFTDKAVFPMPISYFVRVTGA